MTEKQAVPESPNEECGQPDREAAPRPASEAIQEIENLVDSRVLAYISKRSLGPWDILPAYQLLEEIGKQERITVIVQSRGGFPDDAFKLATVIREFGKQITYIVPTYANSAATLLCLSGDSILMGPTSELGPTNPMMLVDERLITPTVFEPGGTPVDHQGWDEIPRRQMAAHALRDFLTAAGVLTPEGGYDPDKLSVYLTKGILNPFLLGDFERSGKISLQYAENLLRMGMFRVENGTKASEIARTLCEGYFDHSYPIGRKEARERLSLKIEDMPDELWRKTSDLVAAYDRMMASQRILRVFETTASYEAAHRAPLEDDEEEDD